MGMMAHYSPFEDRSLAWALARVLGATPPVATWGSPAVVSFARVEALRGEVPETFAVTFDQPREAGEMYFYAERDFMSRPDPFSEETQRARQERRAQLDAMPVPLPEIGATVIVWLSGSAPAFTIPTPYMAPDVGVELQGRWIAADPASLARVRELLAKGPPPPIAPPG
jgi:hypothetical protein